MSSPIEIRTGDFSKLKRLLTQKQWKLADDETRTLMCKIAGREETPHLVPEAIAVFPCDSLKLIDTLWATSSHGRFGFSAQCELWLECGGAGKINDYFALGDVGRKSLGRIESKFVGKAGWLNEGAYSETHLSNLTFGHLPYSCLMCSYGSGLVALVLSAIVWRLQECGEAAR
jgi:hypothetical protein